MLGVVKISDQQNSKFRPKPISTLSAIQMQKPTARKDIILKQFLVTITQKIKFTIKISFLQNKLFYNLIKNTVDTVKCDHG
jgi:hypothetical protein